MSFCCLLYHGIEDRRRWGYLSPAELRRQLEWLAQREFTVEGFAGLESRIADRLPEPYAVVTFDDGHRSSLTGAEILAEAACRPTVFAAVDACRRDPNYLNVAGLRRLAEIADVGSHTVSHRSLTHLGPAQLRAELADSKSWLEDVLGREVAYLSAPFGDLDRRVVETALECGYRLIGSSGAAANDPAAVKRQQVVNRLAVDYATAFPAFCRAVDVDPAFFRRRRWRALVLKLPRRIVRRYLPRGLGKKIVRLWSRWR